MGTQYCLYRKKKAKGYCMYMDYHTLNASVVANVWPLPHGLMSFCHNLGVLATLVNWAYVMVTTKY